MRLLRLAVWALTGAAWAQTPGVSPTPGPTPPSADVRADYLTGAGDVLDIMVFGNEDLSGPRAVQPNGTLSMPLLGDVAVAGLAPAEIQRKLTTLLARDYLVNPQVEVTVKEYQSQFVFVVGEVNNAGRKPLRGQTRLIDVLLEAGGFNVRASGEVVITRSDGFGDGNKTLRLRLSTSGTAQDHVNLELPMRNGDIVTALPKNYVTVEGEVNRPGRYVIEGELTVTGAISTAGGLTRFGGQGLKLRRSDPVSGKAEILSLDLKAIRKGKRPDLVLQPNDVLSVPRRLL